MNNRGRIALAQITILILGFVGFVFISGLVTARSGSAAASATLLPHSSYLSNFIGTGYSQDSYLFEGKVYAKGTPVNGVIVGQGGVGTKVAGSWRAAGSSVDALASGVQWAVVAYLVGNMLGNMFGMTGDNSKALGTSLAAGFGTYKALSVYGKKGLFSATGKLNWIGANPALTGLGIGVVIFALTYKKVTTKIVTFNCMPWQAPSGGDNCQVCNDDKLPCSEYRCKSLGQGCEIVNSGTKDEKCVYVNPRNVNPPIIKPNYNDITKGFSFKNVKNALLPRPRY